jgi:hypothetical protein
MDAVADGSDGYAIRERGFGQGCLWGALIGALISLVAGVVDRSIGEIGWVVIAAPVGAVIGGIVGGTSSCALAAYEAHSAHPDGCLHVSAALSSAGVMALGVVAAGPTGATGLWIGLALALTAATAGAALAPRVVSRPA